MSIKSLLNVIEKPVSKAEHNYSVRTGEIFYLQDNYEECRAIYYAFRYGFERGRRCERARQKEKKHD